MAIRHQGKRTTKALILATALAGFSGVQAEPPPLVQIYGTGSGTASNAAFPMNGSKIYRLTIDGTANNKSELFATLLQGDPATGDTSSPNGVAVDKVRGLLFFAGGDGNPGIPDELYSIPLNTPVGNTVEYTEQGTLGAVAKGAAMYDGDYYYLEQFTSNWWKTEMDASGKVVSNTEICTAGSGNYELGDIAGLQGTLYMSVKKGSKNYFVTLKLNLDDVDPTNDCELAEFEQAVPRPLQLAWGTDYKLYGYLPGDNENDSLDYALYTVDTDDGELHPVTPDYRNNTAAGLGGVWMSDIDSLPPEARVVITKKTNGTDNPDDGLDDPETGPELTVGDDVTWTYEILNGGQLELTNVTVTDDKVDAADIDCGLGSPSNVIPTLAVGAKVICEATGTVEKAGQYVNVGTATAHYASQFDLDGDTVTDSDDDRYVGVEEEGDHDVALLVIDRDSFKVGERCSKHKDKRHYDRDDDDDGHKYSKDHKCYSGHKHDRDDDDDGHRHHNKSHYAETLNSGSGSWTSQDLGTPAFGKRSILPYFANPLNFNTDLTLVTGSVDKSKYDGSSEAWFAPDCIPKKWLSGTSTSSSDNTCMTGTDRQAGINNFFFFHGLSYDGQPDSLSIEAKRLKDVPSVLPLRARGLKLLEDVKVCAVVYADDVGVSYKKKDGKNYDYDKKDRDDDDDGKRRGERCGDKYDSDRYSSSHHRGGDYNGPLIRADLSGKTYGIVAFRVNEARDRSCKDCLPEVDVTILDPALTCNSLLLYNAPVPNGPKYPKDLVTEPLYNQTGYKKYRSLFYDNPNTDLLF